VKNVGSSVGLKELRGGTRLRREISIFSAPSDSFRLLLMPSKMGGKGSLPEPFSAGHFAGRKIDFFAWKGYGATCPSLPK